MNDIGLNLLHFFCTFLEFAISNIQGIDWLCDKLQFLLCHSRIKVKYQGTFEEWFQF